jgi:hypothetical protein
MVDYRSLVGGALRSPEDPAAPRLARYRPVGALPPSALVPLSSPQYQRAASSCLPHAVAFALESDVVARTGAVVQASIMDAYYGYRTLAYDWPDDVGSYPEQAEAWHRDYGTLPDAFAPYDPAIVTTWRPPVALAPQRAGWTARIERMPADVAQIKAELEWKTE